MVESIILWVFAGVSALVFVIDLRSRVIPDVLVIPGFVGTTAARLIDDLGSGFDYLLTGIALIVFFGSVWFFSGGKMGLGDVKLAGYIGSVLGFRRVLIAVFSAGIISILITIPLLALHKIDLSARIAFGPILLAGSWIAIAVYATVPWVRTL